MDFLFDLGALKCDLSWIEASIRAVTKKVVGRWLVKLICADAQIKMCIERWREPAGGETVAPPTDSPINHRFTLSCRKTGHLQQAQVFLFLYIHLLLSVITRTRTAFEFHQESSLSKDISCTTRFRFSKSSDTCLSIVLIQRITAITT